MPTRSPGLHPVPPGIVPREGGGGGAGGSARAGGSGYAPGGALPSPDARGPQFSFPPAYFPPEGATDFFVFGVQGAQVAGTTAALGSVQLPQASRGVIRSVTVGIGNMTAAADVLWRITLDGAPAPGGWGSIRLAPRGAAFVSASFSPDECFIRVPVGATVALESVVVAGGPFDMSGQLHGWSWGA